MMKGLAFLAAGALLYALHIAAGDHGPLTIADLNGAAQRYPLAALALSLAVLGLGGLPPLAGFMSKWQIFVAGFETQNRWIDGLGGLRGAEQRAVPGLLCAAGQRACTARSHLPLSNRANRCPSLMNVPVVVLLPWR